MNKENKLALALAGGFMLLLTGLLIYTLRNDVLPVEYWTYKVFCG